MNLAAIPEVHVESAGDEVTYDLPRRNLGWLRLAGLLPIGFSVLWCGGVGTIIIQQFHNLTSHPQLPEYCICAFLLCFLLPGLLPAGFGLLVLFGRCRVRWHNGHLAVSERVGPFGWPRRMPRQPIRKFVVRGGTPVPGERPLPGFATLAALSANFDNGLSGTVATGYPRPWLEAIAQDLSVRAGLAQSSKPPPVEIYQGLAKELAVEAVEKPAGSKVVLQRRDASVVLEVPAAGLWKGSLGLFPFALLWCVMIGAVTVAFLFGGQLELKIVPILAIFWLVGLGLMIAVINLGKNRVTFTAGHSQLTVVKSGPLGTKRFDYPRADIADINAGASNIQMNHRPVPELQVRLTIGKRLGFLKGRDLDELRWIAMELRNALGMSVPASAAAFDWGDGRAARPRSQRPITPLARFISFAVFGIFALIFCRQFLPAFFTLAGGARATPPATKSVLTNEPIPADPTLVFNTFGPAKSYQPTTSWGVLPAAHAEWFVPTLSGNLSEIQAAVEADGGNPHPGKATIFVTTDNHGFPGTTLESFSIPAKRAMGLHTLESKKHPALQAGVKYWLCARSKGGWRWHFNDQKIIHNSAREVGKNEWASAGDYCYIGAFSIRVSTNQPAALPDQPALEVTGNSTNN